jgi:hypothetical protein
MLDGRAVETFSAAFGLHFFMAPYERDRDITIFSVRVAGPVCARVLQALYPAMAGTHKGAQTRDVLLRSGYEVPVVELRARSGCHKPETVLLAPTRRSRDWLLDRSKFDQSETIWAAGLFVGEGHCGVQLRRKAGKEFRYPMLSLSMLDEAAVSRFANAFFAKYGTIERASYSTGRCFRVHVSGSSAEAALRAMYPHLIETDKGDQIARVFSDLNLELDEHGNGRTWPRTNGLIGRRLTDSHRAALWAGRDSYWEARRRGR